VALDARGAATLIVPSGVVTAVAEHARAVDAEQPGFESLGVLVLDAGHDHVLRYVRMHNADRRPNRVKLPSEFQLQRRGGLPLVTCHSHPRSEPVPSDLDRRWAARLGLESLAIFSLVTEELKLWRLDHREPREVQFAID
jgi:proteasome lid subunit RPN8/RPN11